MPPYVEAYPNENLTTVMPEQYRYTLPVKAGEQRLLGELTGAACATLVAEIAERHAGPVVLIAPDMQNALRLHDEISQFTDQMVMNLADWETLPYDSFSPHQDIISSRLSTLYQLPTMQRGVLIVGEYAYAARLPTQFSPRSCAGDEKRSAPVTRCITNPTGQRRLSPC